jgi:hypothetical protein
MSQTAMSELGDFQNFLSSGINNGGSGWNYTIPPPSNVILPPQNISQVGGGVTPYAPPPPTYVPLPSNNVSNINNTPNPFASTSSSSSSSSNSAPIDRYGTYRNYKFNPNFDTTNYGAVYDPTKRGSKIYNADLRSRDQYGQEYDVNELNLAGFKDRLKSKKSRYEAPGMTYGELAAKRLATPNASDAMWARYDNTNFGDDYEIGRKYRNRSVDEIKRERDNALEMYKALEEDKSLDHGKKEVVNLMRAVQNRATHLPKHEEIYDYNAFRDLYKVIVEGGHKLKINLKHLSYNRLHHDMRKKVIDPKSKCFEYTYFVADLDDNPQTEDNTGILD